MVDRFQARNAVEQALANLEQSFAYPPLVLIDEHTEEYQWGWVFYWESMRYFETGNVEDMLVGNCPFIVLRSDGSLLQTEQGRALEDQIEELEQALGFRAVHDSKESEKSKKKKKYSLKNMAIFSAVLLSAYIVAQTGIEAAWYLAVAYFLIAISVIFIKAKLQPKDSRADKEDKQDRSMSNQRYSS